MTPANVESRIDAVRVFRTGALVRRVATLPAIQGGSGTIRIVDLPVALDDATVRLESSSPGVVLYDAAVALDAAVAVSTLGSTDERRLAELATAEAKLRARLSAIDGALAIVEGLPLHGRPSGAEGEPPPRIDVAAPLSLVDFKHASVADFSVKKRAVEQELESVVAQKKQLAEHLAQSKGARLPKPDELRKSIVANVRLGDGGASVPIAIEYFVAGARWAPAYVMRTDSRGNRARLELRAVVAQSSGEDWRDVSMTLSTAEMMRHHDLPELTSLRVGRAQPPPKKRGFRPPPADPVELFADYRKSLVDETGAVTTEVELDQILDEETARSTPVEGATAVRALGMQSMPMQAMAPASFSAPVPSRAPSAPPPPVGGRMAPPPPPPPPAMPRVVDQMFDAERSRKDEKVRFSAIVSTRSEGAAMARDAPEPAPELEINPRLMSYESLRMPAPERRRGKLVPASTEHRQLELSRSLDVEVATRIREVVKLRVNASREAARTTLPDRHVLPEASDGFDYVHACGSRVDVPTDGSFHSIPMSTIEAPLTLRYVVVPRESPDVFRFVEIESSVDAPLLRGPCDVYVDRDFLVTIDLPTVPPRGRIRAGLGVDQAIKCARNTSFSEATSGLMGGSLALKHTLKIDLVNHKKEAIDVEVRERIPVVNEREEDVKVELVSVQPPWRPWDAPLGDAPVKGAHAWRVKVEPGARAELVATYAVKLPSKYELAGGNRRD